MSLEVTGLESSRRPASHPRDLQAIARNAREWERLNAPDASLATRTARRPPTPPTPPQDLCRRGPPRRGPRRLKSTAPGTYAAGAPVSTLRWRETPQGAGEPHDTPSHKRTRHNSSYVLRTSRLAAPGPHRVRHAGRFTGHSGPILPGGVFFAAPMPGSDTYGPGTAAPRTRRPQLHAPPPPPFPYLSASIHPSMPPAPCHPTPRVSLQRVQAAALRPG